MFTFQDYLLSEAMGENPAQAASGMGNDAVINLTAEIKKVMRSIDLAEPDTAAWDDPRSFTFLDLIEALEIAETVALERLNSEGAVVDIPGRPGETEHVAANGVEVEGDDQNNYTRFFNSIGDEIKDAIRTVFSVPSGEGESNILPRFVQTFNSQIVDRLMDALQDVGPQQAAQVVSPIISAAKRAVINQEQSRGTTTSAENKQLLRQYNIARKQSIGNKKASTLTRNDRLRLKSATGGRRR